MKSHIDFQKKLEYLTFGDPERSKVMIMVKLLHYCGSSDFPWLPVTA